MRLVVSIMYPDGSLPTQDRMRYYRDEDASDTVQDWEEDDLIPIVMPSGIMTCKVCALLRENAECFGGDYLHVILQEESFEVTEETKARIN